MMACGWMNRWVGGRTDGEWMNRWMDGWMKRWGALGGWVVGGSYFVTFFPSPEEKYCINEGVVYFVTMLREGCVQFIYVSLGTHFS